MSDSDVDYVYELDDDGIMVERKVPKKKKKLKKSKSKSNNNSLTKRAKKDKGSSKKKGSSRTLVKKSSSSAKLTKRRSSVNKTLPSSARRSSKAGKLAKKGSKSGKSSRKLTRKGSSVESFDAFDDDDDDDNDMRPTHDDDDDVEEDDFAVLSGGQSAKSKPKSKNKKKGKLHRSSSSTSSIGSSPGAPTKKRKKKKKQESTALTEDALEDGEGTHVSYFRNRTASQESLPPPPPPAVTDAGGPGDDNDDVDDDFEDGFGGDVPPPPAAGEDDDVDEDPEEPERQVKAKRSATHQGHGPPPMLGRQSSSRSPPPMLGTLERHKRHRSLPGIFDPETVDKRAGSSDDDDDNDHDHDDDGADDDSKAAALQARMDRISKIKKSPDNLYSIGDLLSNRPRLGSWAMNDAQDDCALCQKAFSFTRRKHHCFECGNLFCGACSSNQKSFPLLGFLKQQSFRVCDRCSQRTSGELDFTTNIEEKLRAAKLEIQQLRSRLQEQLVMGKVKGAGGVGGVAGIGGGNGTPKSSNSTGRGLFGKFDSKRKSGDVKSNTLGNGGMSGGSGNGDGNALYESARREITRLNKEIKQLRTRKDDLELKQKEQSRKLQMRDAQVKQFTADRTQWAKTRRGLEMEILALEESSGRNKLGLGSGSDRRRALLTELSEALEQEQDKSKTLSDRVAELEAEVERLNADSGFNAMSGSIGKLRHRTSSVSSIASAGSVPGAPPPESPEPGAVPGPPPPPSSSSESKNKNENNKRTKSISNSSDSAVEPTDALGRSVIKDLRRRLADSEEQTRLLELQIQHMSNEVRADMEEAKDQWEVEKHAILDENKELLKAHSKLEMQTEKLNLKLLAARDKNRELAKALAEQRQSMERHMSQVASSQTRFLADMQEIRVMIKELRVQPSLTDVKSVVTEYEASVQEQSKEAINLQSRMVEDVETMCQQMTESMGALEQSAESIAELRSTVKRLDALPAEDKKEIKRTLKDTRRQLLSTQESLYQREEAWVKATTELTESRRAVEKRSEDMASRFKSMMAVLEDAESRFDKLESRAQVELELRARNEALLEKAKVAAAVADDDEDGSATADPARSLVRKSSMSHGSFMVKDKKTAVQLMKARAKRKRKRKDAAKRRRGDADSDGSHDSSDSDAGDSDEERALLGAFVDLDENTRILEIIDTLETDHQRDIQSLKQEVRSLKMQVGDAQHRARALSESLRSKTVELARMHQQLSTVDEAADAGESGGSKRRNSRSSGGGGAGPSSSSPRRRGSSSGDRDRGSSRDLRRQASISKTAGYSTMSQALQSTAGMNVQGDGLAALAQMQMELSTLREEFALVKKERDEAVERNNELVVETRRLEQIIEEREGMIHSIEDQLDPDFIKQQLAQARDQSAQATVVAAHKDVLQKMKAREDALREQLVAADERLSALFAKIRAITRPMTEEMKSSAASVLPQSGDAESAAKTAARWRRERDEERKRKLAARKKKEKKRQRKQQLEKQRRKGLDDDDDDDLEVEFADNEDNDNKDDDVTAEELEADLLGEVRVMMDVVTKKGSDLGHELEFMRMHLSDYTNGLKYKNQAEKDDMARLNMDMQGLVANMRQSVDEYKVTLDEKTEEIATMQDKLSSTVRSLRKKVRNLEGYSAKLRKQVMDLEEKLRNAPNADSELVAALRAELTHTTQELRDTEKTLASKTQEWKSTETKLQQQKQFLEERSKQMAATMAGLVGQLESMEAHAVQMQAQLTKEREYMPSRESRNRGTQTNMILIAQTRTARGSKPKSHMSVIQRQSSYADRGGSSSGGGDHGSHNTSSSGGDGSHHKNNSSSSGGWV